MKGFIEATLWEEEGKRILISVDSIISVKDDGDRSFITVGTRVNRRGFIVSIGYTLISPYEEVVEKIMNAGNKR